MQIIAIDPGKDKCGLALLTEGAVLWHKVVPATNFLATVDALLAAQSVDCFVLGDGTTNKKYEALLKEKFPHMPVNLQDEYRTTQMARVLYFKDHPPQGIRRLLPQGLLYPPEPIDDYAAVVLGQRFFSAAH